MPPAAALWDGRRATEGRTPTDDPKRPRARRTQRNLPARLRHADVPDWRARACGRDLSDERVARPDRPGPGQRGRARRARNASRASEVVDLDLLALRQAFPRPVVKGDVRLRRADHRDEQEGVREAARLSPGD